jgi:hypothetical protein
MPDIEVLMQEWPPAFEDLLKEAALPGADTALSLEEYARVVCAICDIPVYGSLVQSLHVLLTLHHEFRSNAHFQALQGGPSGGSPTAAGGGGGRTPRAVGVGGGGLAAAAAAAPRNLLGMLDEEEQEGKE